MRSWVTWIPQDGQLQSTVGDPLLLRFLNSSGLAWRIPSEVNYNLLWGPPLQLLQSPQLLQLLLLPLISGLPIQPGPWCATRWMQPGLVSMTWWSTTGELVRWPNYCCWTWDYPQTTCWPAGTLTSSDGSGKRKSGWHFCYLVNQNPLAIQINVINPCPYYPFSSCWDRAVPSCKMVK